MFLFGFIIGVICFTGFNYAVIVIVIVIELLLLT